MVRVFVCFFAGLLVLPFWGCRKPNARRLVAEQEQVPSLGTMRTSEEDPSPRVVGMFLLNSGGRGNNEATIDYLDFESGIYHRNLYAEYNRSEVESLGDHGTDIAVYGDYLYVVLNGSHRVEVLDVRTAQRVASIGVNDCRSVAFEGKYGYVTSRLKRSLQAQPVPLGEVIRFRVDDHVIDGHLTVGCQPERMLISGERMFVSNSGSYNAPHYDNRVSIVDLHDFVQTGVVRLGVSPFEMVMDRPGYLWVTTRGVPGRGNAMLYRLENKEQSGFFRVYDSAEISSFSMSVSNDSLFLLRGKWSSRGRPYLDRVESMDMLSQDLSESQSLLSRKLLARIEHPTSLAVHPTEDYFFITDARNYTSSGVLYCFSKSGRLLWGIRTGIIPQKVAFVWK